MKRIMIVCIGLVILPNGLSAQSAKVEKRLVELLAPANSKPALFADEPAERKATSALADFSLPIRRYDGIPARLPEAPAKDVRPRPAPEGTPLLAYRAELMMPAQANFATQPLIRMPSVDVRAPLPIPILAQPSKDRASLADPALDASLAAALKPLAPTRDQPVPFVPLNLPDPFEHVRYGQLRHPPEESAAPPVIPLERPTK